MKSSLLLLLIPCVPVASFLDGDLSELPPPPIDPAWAAQLAPFATIQDMPDKIEWCHADRKACGQPCISEGKCPEIDDRKCPDNIHVQHRWMPICVPVPPSLEVDFDNPGVWQCPEIWYACPTTQAPTTTTTTLFVPNPTTVTTTTVEIVRVVPTKTPYIPPAATTTTQSTTKPPPRKSQWWIWLLGIGAGAGVALSALAFVPYPKPTPDPCAPVQSYGRKFAVEPKVESQDFRDGKEFGQKHAIAIMCSMAVIFITLSFVVAKFRRSRRARLTGAAHEAVAPSGDDSGELLLADALD